MKSPIRLYFLFVLIALIATVGCKKSKDKEKNPETTQAIPGTMSVKVDGILYSVKDAPDVKAVYVEKDDEYMFAFYFDKELQDSTVLMEVGFSAKNIENVTAGDVFISTNPKTSLRNTAWGEYQLRFKDFNKDIWALSDRKEMIATVKISKFDLENKIISCTFSYKAKDSETGIIYEITEGICTEIPFTKGIIA